MSESTGPDHNCSSKRRKLSVIMRHVSPAIAKCELTCLERVPIDVARVAAQHAAYSDVFIQRSQALGEDLLDVTILPPLEDFPDSMFVEDVAIVVNECAVCTRPGVASRQGEVAHIVETLKKVRERVFFIEEPGTIDGGDVLVIGKHVFVGSSTRTNISGFQQLQSHLQPFGYQCQQLKVKDCMHLKCAVTLLNDHTVLLQQRLLADEPFLAAGLSVVRAAPGESPDGGNVLSFHAGGKRTVCVAAAFPETAEIIRKWAANEAAEAGALPVEVVVLEADEVAKAEGALTCCSLLCYSYTS